MNHHRPTHRLGSYLTLGLGAGILGTTETQAITLVTVFGPGSRNPGSATPTPNGIDMGINAGYFCLDFSNSAPSFFGSSFTGYFTHGTDLAVTIPGTSGSYFSSVNGTFTSGSAVGNQNYASISFENDGVYEAVGQFYLSGDGNGYLVALARNDDGSALSISAGKAAIDPVPEPSSLALLSLGAAGILARRRRTK